MGAPVKIAENDRGDCRVTLPPRKRRIAPDAATLAVLFGIGLLLRLAHLYTIRDDPQFVWLILDPRMYDEWARGIAAGDWLGERAFFQDPLYAYLLALPYRLFGVGHGFIAVIQSVAGALVAPLLYRAALPWFGRTAATIGGAIAALYAVSIYYEGMILKTAPAMFGVALVLAVTSRALREENSRLWFVAGLLLGATMLLRGNLVLFGPLLIVWIVFDGAVEEGGARTPFGTARSRAAGIALLAGIVLLLTPVAVRNRVVGGEWILTTSNAGQNFYIGNHQENDTGRYRKLPFVDANPKFEERAFATEAQGRAGRSLTPSQVSQFWFAESMHWIVDDPAGWAALLWRKARLFWGAFEVPDNLDFYMLRDVSPVLRLPLPGFGLIAPLGLLGGLLCLGRAGWPRLLILLILIYSATVIAFFVFSRFRMPMMPALFVFAGYAVERLFTAAGQARRGPAGRKEIAYLAAGLVGLLLVVNLPVRAHGDSLRWRVAESLGLPRTLETSAQGHFNLGVSLAARTEGAEDPARLLKLAEAELRISLAADDRWAVQHVELAKVLARQGKNREAVELYRRAAELEPADSRNFHGIGLLERRLGDDLAAEAAFREALRLRPQGVASANQLAATLIDLQRPDEAVAVYEYVLRISPGNPHAAAGLAAAEAARSRLSEP